MWTRSIVLASSLNTILSQYSPEIGFWSPECQPKTDNNKWYKCSDDVNAWYGVVESSRNLENAVSQCTASGGAVMSVTDSNLDQCAFNALYSTKVDDTGVATNEFVYYSGSFYSRSWYWTQNFLAKGEKFSYTNWGENVNPNSETDCMGGFLPKNGFSFGDYEWVTESCKSPSYNQGSFRVLCRVDCADQVTQGQYLTIAAYSGGTILQNYAIVNGVAQANPTVLNMPYASSLPMMVWNYEQNALQLVGDKLLPSNPKLINNQGFLKLDGTWSSMDPNTFDGRWGAGVVYTPEIGTIMIGGSFSDNIPMSSTIQLYAPHSWETNQEMTAFPDLNYARIRLTTNYYQGKIYAAGGGQFRYEEGVYNYLETMENVDSITGPSDVAGLSWKIIQSLSTPAQAGNMQFIGNNMYWFGYTGSYWTGGDVTSNFVEVYDISSQNTVEVDDPAFQVYNYMPASYNNGTYITVIGGFAKSNGVNLTEGAYVNDIGDWSQVDTVFKWDDNGEGNYMSYTEFLIN